MSNQSKIVLENGKYTFYLDKETLYCLRNGKPWRDFIGDKGVTSLFEFSLTQETKLKETQRALSVAANQLEGVSLAIEAHGRNIDTSFFITTYKKMATEARTHLSDVVESDDRVSIQDLEKIIAQKDKKILGLEKELRVEMNRNPVYRPATKPSNKNLDAPRCSATNHLWNDRDNHCQCGTTRK